MLRAYIYNEDKNNWIEEESYLLFHDLCAFLDEKEKIVYLWNGPKSTEERLEKGYESIEHLFSSYPDPDFVNSLKLIILEEDIPKDVQKKLNNMLEAIRDQEDREQYQFSRLSTIRLYFIFSVACIVLPFLSILNLITVFFWPTYGNYIAATPELYSRWLLISKILLLITFIVFIGNVIVGIVELEVWIVIVSLMGFIVCIGLLIYLNQGIYLFLFGEESTDELYLIELSDLRLFIFINLIGVLVFLIPNTLKLFIFLKDYRDYIFT